MTDQIRQDLFNFVLSTSAGRAALIHKFFGNLAQLHDDNLTLVEQALEKEKLCQAESEKSVLEALKDATDLEKSKAILHLRSSFVLAEKAIPLLRQINALADSIISK